MASGTGPTKRTASTVASGPSVSTAAFKELQTQLKDQDNALQIATLKLDMVLKPLSRMMSDALGTDQSTSFDFDWKIHTLRAAGLPKEFVDLCATYQEYCDKAILFQETLIPHHLKDFFVNSLAGKGLAADPRLNTRKRKGPGVKRRDDAMKSRDVDPDQRLTEAGQ